MKRRNFVKKIGVGFTASSLFTNSGISKSFSENTFKLNYAPHLGMFKNTVGEDPIDQINFMADVGFRAFEDNNMKQRSVSIQEKISSTLTNRDMRMGVFVAHKIYWNEIGRAHV